jgi:hypothetical protein
VHLLWIGAALKEKQMRAAGWIMPGDGRGPRLDGREAMMLAREK